MKEQIIERIPIAQIHIANPRPRSRGRWQMIVANIREVGLKKPITVVRRSEPNAEGEQFDLVCGQGRIEAFLALPDCRNRIGHVIHLHLQFLPLRLKCRYPVSGAVRLITEFVQATLQSFLKMLKSKSNRNRVESSVRQYRRLSTNTSKIAVWVIPTEEALQIAHEFCLA
jgi:hypothetical protein